VIYPVVAKNDLARNESWSTLIGNILTIYQDYIIEEDTGISLMWAFDSLVYNNSPIRAKSPIYTKMFIMTISVSGVSSNSTIYDVLNDYALLLEEIGLITTISESPIKIGYDDWYWITLDTSDANADFILHGVRYLSIVDDLIREIAIQYTTPREWIEQRKSFDRSDLIIEPPYLTTDDILAWITEIT